MYAALRAESPGGFAEDAILGTLTFVPFRDLPPWFKWRKIASRARDKLETWRLTATHAAEDAWRALRGRRS
ncbi:hypothetical protein [Streptomyces sp. NRRL WC-3618]|uniref:hypothetical protein n=1 Tax=Streptomyces sp. NRRL WC-3618 TaxID=1519490 RepID=UPI0006B06C10|nr:hypothetical protein [Streptomyces sp. NRRL WC-3618]